MLSRLKDFKRTGVAKLLGWIVGIAVAVATIVKSVDAIIDGRSPILCNLGWGKCDGAKSIQAQEVENRVVVKNTVTSEPATVHVETNCGDRVGFYALRSGGADQLYDGSALKVGEVVLVFAVSGRHLINPSSYMQDSDGSQGLYIYGSQFKRMRLSEMSAGPNLPASLNQNCGTKYSDGSPMFFEFATIEVTEDFRHKKIDLQYSDENVFYTDSVHLEVD